MAIKPKKIKRTRRERAKHRIRKNMFGTYEHPRLSVFKSDRYTYAQLIADDTGKTLVAASTMEKEVMAALPKVADETNQDRSSSSKSIKAAKALGMVLAERAKSKNIKSVIFDRNGFVYHGRIQAVAEGARAGGLDL